MKVNSPRALELGRELYRRLDGDWSRLREAGTLRSDGVLEVRMPSRQAGAPESPEDTRTATPHRAR